MPALIANARIADRRTMRPNILTSGHRSSRIGLVLLGFPIRFYLDSCAIDANPVLLEG
jgi:hypothetical protein